MSTKLPPKTADHQSIRAWLNTWGSYVANRDFGSARALFDTDVVGFGTYSDFVAGLDNLEREQWQKVWPKISDFRFDVEGMWTETSQDRLCGHLAARWFSTGFDEQGRRYERPGRCTVTLRRASLDDGWLGTHTHFSLERDTPSLSHGESGE